MDIPECPGTGRCLRWHEAAKHIENSSRSHRHGAVEIAGQLSTGPGKVNLHRVASRIDTYADGNVTGTRAIIIQPVPEKKFAGRQFIQQCLRQPFPVVLQSGTGALKPGRTV